ncbi:MAG: hypothetical protein IJI41_06980 [Anaerolineaceae bacterium]|nr:hypothetical protein [Anaerolineaceae bacterium]
MLKNDEMTQPVGIGQDGRLWTAPTTGTALDPVDKTSAMTQPVGKDADGKLWTAAGGSGSGAVTGTAEIWFDGAQTSHTVDYTIFGNAVVLHFNISSLMFGAAAYFEVRGLPADVVIDSTTVLTLLRPSGAGANIVPLQFAKAANGALIVTAVENVAAFSIPQSSAVTGTGSANSPYYWQYLNGQTIMLYKN